MTEQIKGIIESHFTECDKSVKNGKIELFLIHTGCIQGLIEPYITDSSVETIEYCHDVLERIAENVSFVRSKYRNRTIKIHIG